MSQKIDELPEPTDELQTIDYFRITLQIGQLRGDKPIKVHWCQSADQLESDESLVHSLGGNDKTSKLKVKSSKHTSAGQLSSLQTSPSQVQRQFQSSRGGAGPRVGWRAQQVDHDQGGTNVNLSEYAQHEIL